MVQCCQCTTAYIFWARVGANPFWLRLRPGSERLNPNADRHCVISCTQSPNTWLNVFGVQQSWMQSKFNHIGDYNPKPSPVWRTGKWGKGVSTDWGTAPYECEPSADTIYYYQHSAIILLARGYSCLPCLPCLGCLPMSETTNNRDLCSASARHWSHRHCRPNH